MNSDIEPSGVLSFLAGGGEMGERIRGFDWSSTMLGPPQGWPQSLKTSIRIMLMSRQPVWIGWGPDLLYFYNDPYFSIIGGKHPWALGRPTREVWAEIWDVIGPMLETAMSGDEGTYVEEQLLIMERHGYPEETYYTFSYSPIPDDEGRPGGIICANTDDTQRVIGQRELALLRDLSARTAKSRSSNEACERSIASLSTDLKDIPFAGIYTVNEDSGIATLCGASGVISGHRLIPKEISLDNSPYPLQKVLDDRSPQVIEALGDPADLPTNAWPIPPTNAVILPLLASGEVSHGSVLIAGLSPYRMLDEAYLGFLNLVANQIAVSISDAEAAESELKRLEAMAELDRAKTTFFANISHEFRTPLTLMLGPLQDILLNEQGAVPARIYEELETAQRNGVRLQKLVNALLDFSRLEAGRVQAEFRPTDLSRFSCEIASAFKSAVEKAGLELVLDCPPLAEEDYPFVDRDLWEKVVLNLVSNALKHTFEGRITVAASNDGEQATLRVSDTGIGIEPADLQLIFDRFRRVEGARARTLEGSGIGLALVQEIVKIHGGQISVESKTEGAERGTTFTIQIPLGTAHLEAGRIKDDVATSRPHEAAPFVSEALRWLPDSGSDPESSQSAADDSVFVPARNSGAQLLIADDNADMRGYLNRLLNRHFNLKTVKDGKAALDSIAEAKPDLLITDVMMPVMDGFELVTQLRNVPETAELPIIMLSARAGEEAKIEALDAGADDYLVKPFSSRELIARVDSALTLARIRREASEAQKQVEALLAAEKRILELITTGTPQAEVLKQLVLEAEALSRDGMICSVLLLDETGTCLLEGAAPNLPPAYSAAINGVKIGPKVGSCGTAAFEHRPVFVSDIENDPLWSDYKDLALSHGLRACCSRPVFASQGDLLGTVAMYYLAPHYPSAHDQELIERAARLAGIVIERDRALASAESERARLRDLFTQAPAIICVLRGPDHVFELANPLYLSTVGRSDPELVLGKPLREALPEVLHQGYPELLDEVYTTGKPFTGHEMLVELDRRGDGVLETVYLDFVYQPSRNAKDEVNGVLVYAVDVSEQVLARHRVEELAQELELRVQQRTAELLHANEQLQGFTYSVAHDLRQQIRGISLNASMIIHDLGEALNEESQENLRRLVRASKQLGTLVDDLLSYARLSKLDPTLERVNLTDLAREVSQHLRNDEVCLENVQFVIDPTPDVVGDKTMLRMVLENLFDNACKYSARVSKPVVEFGFQNGSFFVRDNGMGFDMAYSHKLFQPLERLHNDESISGTGIGLANVRRIIERHGGAVWGEGEVGHGATFRFTLPNVTEL